MQYNPRSCYMQTRWTTHPTIFLAVRFFAGSQLPTFLEWNRRTELGKYIFFSNGSWNNICTSYDSHSVFLNMRETSWHLLRLGIWNLIDILPNPCWVMLFFDGFFCSRIGQNQCCIKCVWYCNALFQTAHFWNKFQMKLFLFQWLGPVFLSSSYPKIGISSKRSNLHISLFLRFVTVLWIIDKHSNKL